MSTRSRIGVDIETVSYTFDCGRFIMIRGNRIDMLVRTHHKVCEVCKNFKAPSITKKITPGSTRVVNSTAPEYNKEYRKINMEAVGTWKEYMSQADQLI